MSTPKKEHRTEVTEVTEGGLEGDVGWLFVWWTAWLLGEKENPKESIAQRSY